MFARALLVATAVVTLMASSALAQAIVAYQGATFRQGEIVLVATSTLAAAGTRRFCYVNGFGKFYAALNTAENTVNIYRCDDGRCQRGCTLQVTFSANQPTRSYFRGSRRFNYTGRAFNNIQDVFGRFRYDSARENCTFRDDENQPRPNVIDWAPADPNACLNHLFSWHGFFESGYRMKLSCTSGTPEFKRYDNEDECIGSLGTGSGTRSNNTCFESDTRKWECVQTPAGSAYAITFIDSNSAGRLIAAVVSTLIAVVSFVALF